MVTSKKTRRACCGELSFCYHVYNQNGDGHGTSTVWLLLLLELDHAAQMVHYV